MSLAMVPQSQHKISPVEEEEEKEEEKREGGEKRKLKKNRVLKYIALHARYAIFPHASRGARTKKRSVGRLPLQRHKTSLRRFRVATTRSPGFPLDFLRYPIDFPSERSEKGEGEKESANCPYPRAFPLVAPPLPLQRLFLAGVEKKIEFQLDPRGEQGRFVRVNPFMAGAQWRDGNRSENKSRGAH